MTNYLRSHLIQSLDQGIRYDGRRLDEYREIIIEDNVSANAESSSKVKFGDTEVIAGIKIELAEPFPDMPNKGILVVNLILSPMASPQFSIGPPSSSATELSRIIDRGIRESKTINLDKLCLEPGKKVYSIFVDIVVINDDGNLIDASMIAAIRALKLANIPNIVDERLDYKHKGKNKLPLEHEPIAVTVYKIGNHYLIDPTKIEEDLIDSKFHAVIREDNKLCALQKGGYESLSNDDIKKMLNIITEKQKKLRELIII